MLKWLYQKIRYFVYIFILRSQNDYVERFRGFMSEEGIKYVKKAYCFSMKVHSGQYRGDKVTDYFSHCLDLCNYISLELGIKNSWEMIVSGFLHDTVEDFRTTLTIIKSMFNLIVSQWVNLLTKYEYEKKLYIPRIWRANIVEVLIIKLSDRVVNLRTLGMKPGKDFQVKQINETIRIYLPLADKLIQLIAQDEKWKNKDYIGSQIKSDLKTLIKSFKHEYPNDIMSLPK